MRYLRDSWLTIIVATIALNLMPSDGSAQGVCGANYCCKERVSTGACDVPALVGCTLGCWPG